MTADRWKIGDRVRLAPTGHYYRYPQWMQDNVATVCELLGTQQCRIRFDRPSSEQQAASRPTIHEFWASDLEDLLTYLTGPGWIIGNDQLVPGRPTPPTTHETW